MQTNVIMKVLCDQMLEVLSVQMVRVEKLESAKNQTDSKQRVLRDDLPKKECLFSGIARKFWPFFHQVLIPKISKMFTKKS